MASPAAPMDSSATAALPPSNDADETCVSKEALLVYISGSPGVWPAKFMALLGGKWSVIELEWLTYEHETPNAEEVFQVWRRDDPSLLIPVWRCPISKTTDEDGEEIWLQKGDFSKAQELSVGWVLNRLHQMGEEPEVEDAGFFEYFITFPDVDPTPNPAFM